MDDIFAGVDGGGTRTRAVLAERDGDELTRAEGPPSLVDPERPEASAAVVVELIRKAADQASVELPIAGLTAGIAGTGRAALRERVETALREGGVARKVRVVTDAAAAFFDTFHEGPGLLLVAGTGSMAWGRAPNGREARVGGWGSHIGDEGSGYAIGLEALRRVMRAEDGRGPETSLTASLLATTGADGPDDLVSWAAAAGKREIAGLVPRVEGEADRGDAVAAEVLSGAASDLEAHLVALLEHLGPWEGQPRLALSGGLVGLDGPLRVRLEAAMARLGVTPVDRDPDPLRGALAIASGGEAR